MVFTSDRKPIKLLHVYAGNLYGGIENTLVTLAKYATVDRGFECRFALAYPGRLADELRAAGHSVALLGPTRFSRPWSILRARSRLAKAIAEHRPDAVVHHAPWSQAAFGPVARRLCKPSVFWMHTSANGQHWVDRAAAWFPPDLAIVNSRYTASALPSIFPRVGHEVLYNPVCSPAQDDRDRVRSHIRNELETADDAVVITLASRLEALKGHVTLVEALALMRQVPGWVAWIAGGVQRPSEQDYLEHLTQLVTERGLTDRVRFIGERSDVSQLLQASDIHCQPNHSGEGFGIGFIEALYAGIPVVTTAIGGALEIVNDDCGLLVPPHDADALSRALTRLVTDPGLRQKLGAAGPERARALTDPDIVIERMHTVFTTFLADGSSLTAC